MVPIAPVSLYGVVYNLSHGMVALVYIIGAIAMFLPPTAIQHYQSTSHPPGRLIPMQACASTRCGFSHRMDFVAGLSVIPYAGCRLGGVAVHAILPQIPIWVWPLIYVAIGTGINYLGIQQTAKFDKLLVFIQLGILAILWC